MIHRAAPVLALLLAWELTLVSPRASAEAPKDDSPEFPAYVMRKLDNLYRGASSQAEMTMKVKTQHWTRSMAMEAWSLGKDYTLVRILRPLKEKGTATLKARNDLFVYLNKTGRTVKITSGMMGGSWMGSHFTNDDLVKHSRLGRDYTIKLEHKGEERGQKIYRFALAAKPDAPVVWDKVLVTVRQSDLQPLRQDFFDEEGRKVRVMELSGHREVGGRVVPTTMLMKPLDKPGEFTLVTWEKIDFGVKLDQGFFSIQRLRTL